MPLRENLGDGAQALLGMAGLTDQNNQDDTAPPAPVTPAIGIPPPLFLGATRRLQDKLEDPEAKEISNATWTLMEKAKSDDESQEDMKDVLVNPNTKVLTLWMNPKSAEVKVGLSPFEYISDKLREDPHHKCIILFINDQSERGTPWHMQYPGPKPRNGESKNRSLQQQTRQIGWNSTRGRAPPQNCSCQCRTRPPGTRTPQSL